MAVKIARFTTWQPEDIELHDGTVYPCRQISAAGLDLLQRVSAGEDVERSEVVAEVASLLVGAPLAEVKRCSVEELVSVLLSAAMPAEKMQEALAETAKKKAPAVKPKARR